MAEFFTHPLQQDREGRVGEVCDLQRAFACDMRGGSSTLGWPGHTLDGDFESLLFGSETLRVVWQTGIYDAVFTRAGYLGCL